MLKKFESALCVQVDAMAKASSSVLSLAIASCMIAAQHDAGQRKADSLLLSVDTSLTV